jgi:hypothetical protein
VKKKLIIPILIAAGLALAVFLLAIQPGNPHMDNSITNYDVFAKCLTNNGIKMYGASWCPHCQNQKAMFGDSSKYMPYVECSGNEGKENQACANAGITQYPTWVLINGTRFVGALSFGQLSELTSCALPDIELVAS